MFQTNHLYLDQTVRTHQANLQHQAKLARLEPLFVAKLFAAKLFRWFKHLLVPRPGAQMRHPQPT